MIVISGSLTIKPEHRDEFVAAAVAMGEASRAEDGCGDYVFTADLADANTIRVFEQWESDEALKAHFAMPHFKAFGKQLAGWVASQGSFTRYEVASSGDLFAKRT